MTHYEKQEYYQIIKEILKHEEFQKRKQYLHHGKITVYEHSLAVSKRAYKIAKKFKCDYKAAAIAGLLHDFYDKPWMEHVKNKTPFFKKHGFVHAEEAKNNAYKYFPTIMNKKIENAILRHMFPLNKIPPKYAESWIVTIADKYISLEIFLYPKSLLYLIGLKKRGEK